jgi:uncharacterized protein (DUF58 family)
MSRRLLLSLLITGLVITGLATRNGAYLVLALPVIIYLAAGLLKGPEDLQLEISRKLSTDRAVFDQPVVVTLKITNAGPPAEEVYVEDIVPASLDVIDGSPDHFASLQTGQTLTVEYTVAGKRGLYRFSAVKVVVADHLGLFRKETVLSAPNQFFILPDLVRVKQVAIRPPRTGVYSGLIPARQGGAGVEFFGVREYRPGDPLRWISERASARHHPTLFVNEYEQERMVDVGLIVDARHQSNPRSGQKSLFEYSVQAAGTLGETFLSGGNRVGLFVYGRSIDWTFPGYGKVQRERMVRALARAQLGEGKIFESLEYLPTRLFPVQSQLVFVSPLLADDAEMLTKLRARGYRLLIISPDPISFEGEWLGNDQATVLASQIARAERQLLFKHLREANIQLVDWDVKIPFHQVAHYALSRLPAQRGRRLL